ncbi:hypothetical protein WMF26_43680 [Sorangium sp. So ce185]|uniref:hypothetical protein n=1 Tax=Sorangium sp. So ce185 TaxID=3133287 RepID=UPI003F6354D1
MSERGVDSSERPRASLSLLDVLSEHAVAALDRLDIRRDLSETCPPHELASMLAERGLPIYGPVLELEARAGGVVIGDKTQLATFRALKSRPGFGRSDALVCSGEVLLPIHGSELMEFWMDGEGTIYRGWPASPPWDPEDSGFCAPVYASYVTMFERYAFQREPWWSGTGGADDGYRCSLTIHGHLMGDAMAQALSVQAFNPAWDRYARIWHGHAAHIEEANIPGYHVHTRAELRSVDQLVRALETISPIMDRAPLEIGLPERAVVQPGERAALHFRGLQPGDRPMDVLVYGRPGSYRIQVRRS